MWSETVNKTDSINPFASFLEKDVTSKGDFESDFSSFCTQFNIIRCTNISCWGEEEVRISDVVIDMSSWRAILLAICCVGAKVKRLRVHNCSLTAQHLKDLANALLKSTIVKVIKLQYCSFGFDESNQLEYVEGFKSLLNDANQVEYLSLKGCRLRDDVVIGFSAALQNNYKLSAINLSANFLSDSSLEAVVQAVRLVGSYKGLSFAENPVTAVGVKYLLSLFLGAPSSSKDEADMKGITKSVTDKNKTLKDINKKRKKAGLVEIPDYAPMPECVKTVEGKAWICNYHIAAIDFGSVSLSLKDIEDIAQFLEENRGGVDLNELSTKIYLPRVNNMPKSAADIFDRYINNIVFV